MIVSISHHPCRCHLEVLVHGNLTEAEAVTLARDAATALGPGCCMPAADRTRDACVQLPEDRAILHVQVWYGCGVCHVLCCLRCLKGGVVAGGWWLDWIS